MDAFTEALRRSGGIAHISRIREFGVPLVEIAGARDDPQIIRPRRGWYALESAPAEAIAAVRAGGVVSCLSLLGMYGIWRVDDHLLHISVPRTRSRVTATCVVHYNSQATRSSPVAYDDLPHAIAQTFTCQSRDNVVAILDSALNKGLLSAEGLDEVSAAVTAGKRAWIALADGRAESGLETKCRLHLRARRIRYRVQHRISGVGRVDILVGDRLVVELDGIRYHSGDQVEKDRRRDLELHRRGYIVVRVSYSMLMDEWGSVLAAILGYVERREHRWSARHRAAGLV